MPPDQYTAEVIVGVEANRAEIDAVISRLAKGWTIERMPAMDRLLMEIALFELGHRDDVPTAVVLNEAAELANTLLDRRLGTVRERRAGRSGRGAPLTAPPARGHRGVDGGTVDHDR